MKLLIFYAPFKQSAASATRSLLWCKGAHSMNNKRGLLTKSKAKKKNWQKT